MSKPESKVRTSGGAPPGFYRLTPFQSVRKSFIAGFFFAMVWTIVTGFIIFANLNNPDPQKEPSIVAGIFLVAVNALILIWPVRSFLRLIMTGQTTVDVNSEIAFPGEPLEVIVCQPGKFVIDKCTVDFVCEERATYSQGTDTVTRQEIVRNVSMCELTNLQSREGKTLTHQTVIVPPDAMPTFEAKHNEINWIIRVQMVIPKRPDTEQLFRVRVATPEILAEEGKPGV